MAPIYEGIFARFKWDGVIGSAKSLRGWYLLTFPALECTESQLGSLSVSPTSGSKVVITDRPVLTLLCCWSAHLASRHLQFYL